MFDVGLFVDVAKELVDNQGAADRGGCGSGGGRWGEDTRPDLFGISSVLCARFGSSFGYALRFLRT